MADIGGLLSAALGGGATGVFGQLVNRGFAVWETREKRQDTKLAYEQETRRWANEQELLKIQMQQASEANEQELAVTAVAGSWEGLKASLDADAKVPSSYRWVDAVRAMVRPVLTVGSQGALLLVFFCATTSVQATIQQQVTETILFIATAATLWWFGERAPAGRRR